MVRCGALWLGVLALGCEQRGIEEHRVAKGVEHAPASAASDVATNASASERNADTAFPWAVPEGWVLDPEPRPMRLATYTAPDADGDIEVAVTRFGGRVGGELANVNRWRGQMGLESIGSDRLEAALERFSSAGHEGYLARIESQAGVMLAAGVYEAAIDQTWFVRATVGDAAVADRIEPDLFGMARSIAGPEQKGGG